MRFRTEYIVVMHAIIRVKTLSMWIDPMHQACTALIVKFKKFAHSFSNQQQQVWLSWKCTTKEEIGKTTDVGSGWTVPGLTFFSLLTGWINLFWQTISSVMQHVHSHGTGAQRQSTLSLNFMHLAIKSIQARMTLHCCCGARLCFTHMVKGIDKSKTNEHQQNSQNSSSAFCKIKFFKFWSLREKQFR